MNKINKDWIIGILVVIVLVLVGLFFSGKKETLAPTTNTETAQTTTQSSASLPTQTNTGSQTTSTKPPVKTTTSTQPAVEKTVVTYTDAGFTPSLVVIKRGQAVQFVNQSETNKNLWVASDPYPTNSNYPSFNAGRAIGKGGTYTFTFTKTGTWTYHNDLNPSRRASVIVNYE